jgi:hypothetical protein
VNVCLTTVQQLRVSRALLHAVVTLPPVVHVAAQAEHCVRLYICASVISATVSATMLAATDLMYTPAAGTRGSTVQSAAYRTLKAFLQL